MTDATVTWSAEWAGYRVRVTVIDSAGIPVFVDECDPALAAARRRVLTGISDKLDGSDVTPIEERLLALAAAGRPAVAPTAPAIVDADPEPWHETVDGAALLHDMTAVLKRHVVLPDHGAVVAALWALTTHVSDRFPWTPRLLFASPVMRSGKTLALRLVGALVARPLTTEGISAPALFRIIEKVRPCLLLDEADTYLSARRDPSESAEAIRGVVNSGFMRGGRVIRCQGDNHEPVAFSTFAPVALAMIGEPPATVLDRSIVVRMRRRATGEDVERIRPGRTLRQQHEDLVRRCARWAQDHGDLLAEAEPAIPAGLNDRQADCWWPLLAVADAVGGDWPERARAAAIALSISPPDDEDAGIRLLRDLREVFGNEARLPTADVVRLLCAVDSAPWLTWCRGGPLTAHALGRLLRPFGVVPERWRGPIGMVRGYVADDLADPWRRYLPAESPEQSGSSGATGKPSNGAASSAPLRREQTGAACGAPSAAATLEPLAPLCAGSQSTPAAAPKSLRDNAVPLAPLREHGSPPPTPMAELTQLVTEMADDLDRDIAAGGDLPFTGAQLREHYRAMVRRPRQGVGLALADAQHRYQLQVIGKLLPLHEATNGVHHP